MFKISYKKVISIFCSLLIIASSFISALTLADAADGVITQSFENYTYSLPDANGFSLYTAQGANDSNVKDGIKSLKWTHTSGSKAATIYSGTDLTVGETYKLELWIKAVTSTGSELAVTQLNDVANGWSFGDNKRIAIPYFGTNYDSIGQWKKFEKTFTADKKALGFLIYGKDDFYFDSITITPVKSDVTVNIVPNNDQTVSPLTGAPGGAMTLPTLTKEGYYFEGWYKDAEFTTPFTNLTSYPSEDLTIYAKWLPNGFIIQNFENYTHTLTPANGFSLYTASGVNDSNVKDGTKSLRRTAVNGSKPATLYPGQKLTVGETYKLELWVKAVTATGSGIEITQLNDVANGWSFSDNKKFVLPYFGTNYDAIGQWKKFEIVFKADKEAMGLLIYGNDDFYFDSITWTKVSQNIQVDFVTNCDTTAEPVKGAEGGDLTLPTLTKEGYYFAGWFENAEFTKPFAGNKFPAESTTLYAKWLKNGTLTQNFENYDLTLAENAGFSIYTAVDENDTNVFDGSHSLYRSTLNNTKVATVIDQYSTLTVGKAYKLTYKLKVVELGDGGGIQFTDLSVRDNPWSYGQLASMNYVGVDYAHLNEWVEKTYIFVAQKPYFGVASWGNIAYYLDDYRLEEIPIVTLSFEMGEGEAKEPQSGAAGANLSIENPIAPEGKAFAGWYLDANFTEPFVVSTYPETDTTLYARWIKKGTFEQSFELWPGDGAFHTSKEFKLYTATDENDPNVYSGKHSMLYENLDSTNTLALNIFDTTMGKLQIGEKYNVSIRFKPVTIPLDRYSLDGTYHSIYNTTLQSNCWTYQSQGPQGEYKAYVFYQSEFTDEYWSGTGNAVTTTKKKDENGWLTMNYEITATTDYIALYMTGKYKMFIDYITITPLESGVVAENYSLPYTEDYYNILSQKEIASVPNQQGKSVYKIEVGTRSDYVFTASLAKGKYGNSRVYLAWDEKGENKLEGTEFIGTSEIAKLYSTRIITDFSGVLYLVVEGGGPGSSDYFSFFPTKYGCAEDPNPYYVHPKIDYNKLPTRLAADADSLAVEDDYSPSTGDSVPIMPIVLLVITTLLIGALNLRKRGNCNE